MILTLFLTINCWSIIGHNISKKYSELCTAVEKIEIAMQTFWCTKLRASMETRSHLFIN